MNRLPHLLILMFALSLGACSRQPDWQKPEPPVWALVGSSTGERPTRVFIHTKAFRKSPEHPGVRALLRFQPIADGSAESAEEFASVQNFTCVPSQEGYKLTAQLAFYSGQRIPNELPSEEQLPKALAWRDFTDVVPGGVFAEARKAACYLAGYK
ncbi:MAG: hypothetical protein HOP19_17455 [Acidobacteria bacterium]|nr:hypothetical protein [Acidobacteriota bacterium]